MTTCGSRTADSRTFAGLDDPSQWTVSGVLRWQANNNPERVAIDFIGGERWTYSSCLAQADHTAAWLYSLGVRGGDSIAVFVDDPNLYCRYWFGLSELGAVMVAINTGLRGESLRHQLDIATSSRILTELSLADSITEVSELPLHCLEDSACSDHSPKGDTVEGVQSRYSDTSCIMFTSGTSGPSKGVLMPQAHCLLFAKGTIDNLGLGADDTYYICLPLFHANGLFMQLLACLVVGARAVVRGRFSASNWLKEIREHGATHTNMLGALAAFVVAQPPSELDRDHLLRVVSAAPLPAVLEAELHDRFGIASVVPVYGMTEVNIPLYGELNRRAPGTAGHLYKQYFDVEIRDPETDEPLADGETGELMVRPRQAFGFMAGYVGMPEKTLESWRNFWFHTGDAAFRRADGYFVFVDRIKDCIRRRGENISSYEVEQAFLGIDTVAEAAAYAVPAEGGEGMEDEVMVALMLKPGESLTPVQLRKLAEGNLAKFAVPRYVRTVQNLPKTPTGKIRKVVLREEGVTADTWDAEKQ